MIQYKFRCDNCDGTSPDSGNQILLIHIRPKRVVWKMKSKSEFPKWVRQHRVKSCIVRCEKALKQLGVENVYQLQGGMYPSVSRRICVVQCVRKSNRKSQLNTRGRGR